MIVKDRMSRNVLTIHEEDMISKAIDLMSSHGLHRLPVVDNGKLVGLLTEGMISKKGATKATSLSIFELNYLLSKINVKTIMEKNVHTIKEGQPLEDAAMSMLEHNIGCLPVVDDQYRLVGIMTQNDLFRSFLDLLGYTDAGSRISVEVEDGLGVLEKVTSIFSEQVCNILHIAVYDKETGRKQLIIRIDTIQTEALEKALEESGYQVLEITKNPA